MSGSANPSDQDVLLARLERDGIERLWVVFHDYLGRACGKVIPKSSFRAAVTGGVVFAKANLEFDHHDQQVTGAKYLADSGDFLAVPDPSSYALLPQFPATARVHSFLRQDDGASWEGCPRTRLAAMIDELADEGYSMMVALEPEFYILGRSTDGSLAPLDATHMYSTSGLAAQEAFIRRVLGLLATQGVDVAQFGQEYQASQYELSTTHCDPRRAVDNYLSVRETVRDAAREFGYEATFMPKPFAGWTGNSLHLHLSIWYREGTVDLTPETSDDTSISEVGLRLMSGLLAHAPALAGLGSPTVNSYKRLLPGSWAPAHTCWGYGNRSGLIRVPGFGNRRHIEYRASDKPAQPEMLLTGILAAGLDGIRKGLDPGEPFQRDVGHMSADDIEESNIGFLPRTLDVALDALQHDDVIGQALGQNQLDSFLRLRRHEFTHYQTIVHEWERETYLPIT